MARGAPVSELLRRGVPRARRDLLVAGSLGRSDDGDALRGQHAVAREPLATGPVVLLNDDAAALAERAVRIRVPVELQLERRGERLRVERLAAVDVVLSERLGFRHGIGAGGRVPGDLR